MLFRSIWPERVDQAALRAAASYGVPIGGWCPPGRVCEDGIIPDLFPLVETPTDRSPDAADVPRSQRTEWNVPGLIVIGEEDVLSTVADGELMRQNIAGS